jgi:hypothetical protein
MSERIPAGRVCRQIREPSPASNANFGVDGHRCQRVVQRSPGAGKNLKLGSALQTRITPAATGMTSPRGQQTSEISL